MKMQEKIIYLITQISVKLKFFDLAENIAILSVNFLCWRSLIIELRTFLIIKKEI